MAEARSTRTEQGDALSLALDQARAGLGSDADSQRVWKDLSAQLGELGAAAGVDAPIPRAPVHAGGLLGGVKGWLTLCALSAVLGGGAWALRPLAVQPPRPLVESGHPESGGAEPVRGVAFHSVARVQRDPEGIHEEAPAEDGAAVRPVVQTRRARRPRVSAEAAAPALADPSGEIALIEAAQQALERSPRKALRSLSLHAERFPRGLLAEEREVMWIDALVRLGRAAEALARVDQFLASFPDSPHRRAVETFVSGSAARDHNTGSGSVLTP